MDNAEVNIPQLTFTRFLAAISFVIFHYGQTAFPFQNSFLQSILKESRITVSYFFFLSGFILYVVYSRNYFSTRNFFVARFARIFPMYFLGFLLTLFAFLFLLHEQPNFVTIITQGLMLHAWFPGHVLAINYPSWSVSVEVFFYLLFPLLLFAARKVGSTKFIIGAIVLWLLSIVQSYFVQKYFYNASNISANEFIMFFPPWHLNMSVAGMACGIIYLSLRNKIKTENPFPILMALTGIVIVIFILLSNSHIKTIMHNGLLAPLYSMIVLGIALDKTIVSRLMSLKPLQFLGEISYGIYLLQCPLWILRDKISAMTGIDLRTTIGFYSCLTILLVSCSLLYLYFEKPARNYIRQFFFA
jgi:peptidoglycan/LPS O-acetylase OafA/YrhL